MNTGHRSRTLRRLTLRIARNPFAVILPVAWVIFLGEPTVCYAANGTDLFIDACRLRGANPGLIHSGYVNYELTLRTVQNGKMLVGKSNEHILLSGNRNSDAKRKYEAWFDKSSPFYRNVAQPTQLLMQGRGSDQAPVVVRWEPGARAAIICEQWNFVPRFQEFGRMQGLPSCVAISMLLQGGAQADLVFPPDGIAVYRRLVSDLTKELGQSVHKIAGKTEYDAGAFADTIESKTKDGKMLQRYWIDPSRGFVCPLVQIFDRQTGALREEYKSDHYFLHKKSGLWYPAHYVEAKYDGKTSALLVHRDYNIDKASFQLNQFVADSEFSIDLPADSTVVDARLVPEKTYRATSPGTLSLAKDGLDVSSIPGLAVETFGQRVFPQPVSRVRGSDRMRRYFVYPCTVLLLICATAIILRRRRGRNVVLLITATILVLTGGCDARPESGAFPIISIVPPLLDFGSVRGVDSPISLTFEIHNNSDEPLVIDDVLSGCGCTVAAAPKKPIPAKGSANVPVSVDLRGRLGQFSNRIIVKPHGGFLPVDAQIKGRVIQDIWHDGQTVRCVADSQSSRVDKTFEIHTVDYPNIAFRLTPTDPRISVKEVSRSLIAGETVIRFSLSMSLPEDGEIILTRIVLAPENSEISPLCVPVLCYRSDEMDNPTISHNITTKQVSLRAVERSKETDFEIHGDPDVIAAVKEVSLQDSADGFSATLRRPRESGQGVLTMTLLVDESAPDGNFKNYVILTTHGNKRYRIPFVGTVREQDADGVTGHNSVPLEGSTGE